MSAMSVGSWLFGCCADMLEDMPVQYACIRGSINSCLAFWLRFCLVKYREGRGVAPLISWFCVCLLVTRVVFLSGRRVEFLFVVLNAWYSLFFRVASM